MEKIKTFFIKTRYFWMVSKALLLLLFIGSLWLRFKNNEAATSVVSLAFLVFILVLVTSLVIDVIKIKSPLLLRVLACICLFLASYSMFLIANDRIYIGLSVGIWMALQGISELVNKSTATNSSLATNQ